MKRFLISGFLITSLMAVPALSAEITNEAKCLSEVEIVKELDQNSDIGDKFEPIVKDLIKVLEELCKDKTFDKAEDVAAAIRGMLATE